MRKKGKREGEPMFIWRMVRCETPLSEKKKHIFREGRRKGRAFRSERRERDQANFRRGGKGRERIFPVA